MKRFLAGILTAAMAVTTFVGFAFSSGAEGTAPDVKGIIPRTRVDATLDAKADEDFWQGAYVETLNESNAVVKISDMDNDPTEDLPSLTLKMAYYSEFKDGTSPEAMVYRRDKKGGILVYMEVIDKHKAFAFGTTEYNSLKDTYTFNGVHVANATDCVQLAFDPANRDSETYMGNCCCIFSFVPYSIGAPEKASSSLGVGTIAGGRGWWWQHWNANVFGYGDNSTDLMKDSVKMAAETDYTFAENHPLPDRNDFETDKEYIEAYKAAYQFASIEGYRIEAKIHWNHFLENNSTMLLKPVIGNRFGMAAVLVDYMFDAPWDIDLTQTSSVEAAQKVYRAYINCGNEDDAGWESMDCPALFNTYEFGDYIIVKEKPEAPAAPAVEEKTTTSVTLAAHAGYEYRIDDGEWQTSNVFEGRTPNTEYVFYQRVAETETGYASDASEGLSVKTNAEQVEIVYGDANGDGRVDISDAMIILYHVAEKERMTESAQLIRCDLNSDGTIDIIDAMRVLYFVANKVPELELG